MINRPWLAYLRVEWYLPFIIKYILILSKLNLFFPQRISPVTGLRLDYECSSMNTTLKHEIIAFLEVFIFFTLDDAKLSSFSYYCVAAR